MVLTGVRAMPGFRTAPDAAVGSHGSSGPFDERTAVLTRRRSALLPENWSSVRWPSGWGSARPSPPIITAEDWTTEPEDRTVHRDRAGPSASRAIVTSHSASWSASARTESHRGTFIAGKIEPGESPAAAAVREARGDRPSYRGGRSDRRPRAPGDRTHHGSTWAAQPTPRHRRVRRRRDGTAEDCDGQLTEAAELMNGMILEAGPEVPKQPWATGA